MCEKNAPTLPIAICAIMKVFDDYAKKDGNRESLSKAELKELLQKEMGPMGEHAKDPAKLDEMFALMDADQSGMVDFPEFMMTLALFACACHGRKCDIEKHAKK